MDLKDYMRVIKRRFVEFLCVILVVVIFWLYQFVQEEQTYSSSAVVTVASLGSRETAAKRLSFIRNINDYSKQVSKNANKDLERRILSYQIYGRMLLLEKAKPYLKATGSVDINQLHLNPSRVDKLYSDQMFSPQLTEIVSVLNASIANHESDQIILNPISKLRPFNFITVLGADIRNSSINIKSHQMAHKELKNRLAGDGKELTTENYVNYIYAACRSAALHSNDSKSNSVMIIINNSNEMLCKLAVNEVAHNSMRIFNNRQSNMIKERARKIDRFYDEKLSSHQDKLDRDVSVVSEFYERFVISIMSDERYESRENIIDEYSKFIQSKKANLNDSYSKKMYGDMVFDPRDPFSAFYGVDEIRKIVRSRTKSKAQLKHIKHSKFHTNSYELLELSRKKLGKISTEIDGYVTQISQLKKQMTLLDLELENMTKPERLKHEIENENYRSVRQSINKEDIFLRDLQEKYTEEHKDVVAQKRLIQNYKTLLENLDEEYRENIFRKHEFKLSQIKTTINYNDGQIEELSVKKDDVLYVIESLVDKQERIKEYEDQKSRSTGKITKLKNELYDLEREMDYGEIISVSVPALKSIALGRKYTFDGTFLLTIIVGIVIAIFVVYIHEYLDTSIKTEHDVRRHLNLPVLAMVGKARKEVILTELPNKDPFSEDFNTAATLVKSAAVDLDLRSFLVTSTVPQEGKTTICVNLAIALARKGLKTIIMDADLRIPTVHDVLEVDNTTGLSTLLEGREGREDFSDLGGVEQFLKPTAVKNLRVLSSGPIPADPISLLESQEMKNLIEELKTHCDYLILDTPPIYNVGDTLTMAGLVDATLFVVGSERVQQDQVTWAKHLLSNVNANILGVFLNMVRTTGTSYYYYYNGYKSYRSRD